MRAIVFSDIDGTITAPSFPMEETRVVMQQLAREGIGVVFVSSKTFHEMMFWWQLPGVLPCFAYETGFGVALYQDWTPRATLARFLTKAGYQLGKPERGFVCFEKSGVDEPAEIRKMLASQGIHIRFLSEIPLETFVQISGLPMEQARWAYARRGPLPFEITAGHPKVLERWASQRGLYLSKGRWLYTLSPVHKGHAVQALVAGFRALWSQVLFWAVGDAPADTRMAIEGVNFVAVTSPSAWKAWVQTLSKPAREESLG